MLCEIDENILSTLESTKNIVSNDLCTVPELCSECLSYSDFFENYLIPNKPCRILNVANSWIAFKEWTENNKPNLNYLDNLYNTFKITVSNCKTKKYNAHITECMDFSTYIKYWQCYLNKETSDLLYLKDWHLKNLTKYNFYNVPKYFSSDWLNEYFTEKTNDDYRFVYMGPSGTWTPFHSDVFTSYSWSVNICGKKKWYLFPPGEEKFLLDGLGNLPFDMTEINHNRKYFEIIQEAGDAIFVPSGWYHQVWNLEDTISINHNWINGCNIKCIWQSLIDNLDKVKKEISDCIDMENWLQHCQLLLKTSFGIDFLMFYDFLLHIATKRIKMLQENKELKQFDYWILGKNHAIFDLIKISDVIKLFIKHNDFDSIDFKEIINVTPNNLLLNINETLMPYVKL